MVKQFVFFCLLVLICTFQLCLLTIWSIQHDVIDINNINKNYQTFIELKNKNLYGINTILHDFFHKDSLHDSYKPAEVVYRVAIIVIYIGPALPSWFDAFAYTAQSSSSLYDWYIFVTEADIRATPPNVHMIKITEDDLATRISKLDDNINIDKHKNTILQLIRKSAYMLVEFKACLGFLFSDYIENYSHWAYGDMDMLLGRMHELIPIEILNRYDIYTSSFGDNFRLYMRGQLTIHRNDPYINNLWRSCLHLSNIGERLNSFADRNYDHWNFQSAEGCYSRVVVDHKKNVSVIVGATQITEAFHDDLREKESFYLGNALLRCYTQPARLNDISRIEGFLDRGIESTKDTIDFKTEGYTKPIQEVDYRCSYWVVHEFQTCLDTVPANADILINNNKIEYTTKDRYKVLDNCREGAISHYQGWKRNFYVFTTRAPTSNSNSMIISENGFIPLVLNNIHQDFSSNSIHGQIMPYGKITFKDIEDSIIDETIKESGRGRGWILPRLSVDSNDWKRTKIGTSYCGAFTNNVQQCSCSIMGYNIEIVQIQDNSKDFNEFPITLITVSWAHEFYSKKLDDMLNSWQGPKIVVLSYIDIVDLNVKPHRKDVTIIEVDFSKCSNKEARLADNTLFNIGLDASPTELVLLSPAGFTFAKSVKKIYGEYKVATKSSKVPISFVIPVFTEKKSLTREERQSLLELEEMNEQGTNEQLISYPPPGSKCASQQSEHLFVDISNAIEKSRSKEGHIDYKDERQSIKIVALDLIKSNSMMLPVMFNVSAGLHGKGFVRLPEELSGVGCFGNMIVRVLAGSGFKVLWSPTFATESEKDGPSEVHASGDCGCVFGGSDHNAVLSAASKFNQYFWRAVELRKYGLSSVAASKRFGDKFEKEQEKLLREK